MEPDLQALLAQYPDLLDKILSLSTEEGKQGLAQQQMNRGEGWFNAQSPQGMRVGGTYVAANPLEHIANMAQRMYGARQLQQGQGAVQQSLATQLAGRKAMAPLLAAALRGYGPAQPVQAPQMVDENMTGAPFL